jgi:hypothetical protein
VVGGKRIENEEALEVANGGGDAVGNIQTVKCEVLGGRVVIEIASGHVHTGQFRGEVIVYNVFVFGHGEVVAHTSQSLFGVFIPTDIEGSNVESTVFIGNKDVYHFESGRGDVVFDQESIPFGPSVVEIEFSREDSEFAVSIPNQGGVVELAGESRHVGGPDVF